ncbi:ribosomal protein S18 [Piedraia hortae CBS 480.64]|uniref:Small ribosomal subunit protein bS18m n=1 Tax=Piedraia hortae CBS 480.64 TaxID=1314780 RepID=A0A6A7BWM1_9PEZI|nr:ribosomal protein S18 [Piedraia hortae CBS 480.64]
MPFKQALQRLSLCPSYSILRTRLSSTFSALDSLSQLEGDGRKNGSKRHVEASPTQQQQSSSFDVATRMVQKAGAPQAKRAADEAMADFQRQYTRQDLDYQMKRKWRGGDVYSPRDLSGYEMAKWKRAPRQPRPTARSGPDVLDVAGIRPIDHYKNFSIMNEFVTDMGRIKHSSLTGLRPANQRRMAKAVRRAIGVGLLPSVHRHPELLRRELLRRQEGNKHY